MFNDRATLGLVTAAQIDGRSVPEDLSILSIGMGEDAAEIEPAITTITPPVGELTAAAVGLMVSAIDGTPTSTEVLLPAPLVERASVRRLT